MKKMMKFGSRKRFNGEDGESQVTSTPVARRVPIGPGVSAEQSQAAYDNIRRLGKNIEEERDAKAEGIRSEDEPLEQVAQMKQKKQKVVTKEEMQKAGFDNLRDYLNYQRGLTRRGESKPAASKPSESKPVEVKKESVTVSASRLPSSNKPREGFGLLSSLKEGVTRGGYEFGQEKEEKKSSSTPKKADKSERSPGFLSSLSKALTSGGREFTGSGHEFGKKHGGKVHKYAKGGSVGSASKRADGIAMRGKTRGMMR